MSARIVPPRLPRTPETHSGTCTHFRACVACKGSGVSPEVMVSLSPEGHSLNREPCPRCQGEGVVPA